MSEPLPIATVRVYCNGVRDYSREIEFAGGTTVHSGGYHTLSAALDTAARVIAEEERLRRAAEDPRGQVP